MWEELDHVTAILLEVLLIAFLAVANGVLAMSEIAIVSVRKARLQELAEDGDRRAKMALELANEPTRFLSTVQIGITLVGILAGAVGGATIAEELGALLSGIPPLAPYGDVIALGIVVLSIAYLSLVIGELVPKRLALTNPIRVATLVASPMRRLSSLAGPIVWLLSASTEAVLRLLRVRPSSEPSVSEDEVKIMLAEATQEGVFEPLEEDMVRRVFRLGDRRVSALMTHRTDIVWLDITEPPQEWLRIITSSGYSRLPVARESLDNILGVVQAKDLLDKKPVEGPADLKSLLSPPVFVPESAPALEVLQRFKESRQPLALVIDEYGGLEGLLTLYDVLEAIVGDLPEAGEAYEPEAIERPDGSWLLDGMLPIDEFKELFGVEELPGEARAHFDTLGGFVIAVLGRIPSTADHFQWNQWCFEVMDMDGRRVDKVLVSPVRRGPYEQPGIVEENLE
jgi:putative hemolysin